MKEIDIKEYNSFLDNTDLTSDNVCDIIRNYYMTFPQNRDKKIEWKTDLPMFITPFYKFVYKNKTVQTQKEFCDYYFSENEKYFKSKSFTDYEIECIRARAYRTYPSLVRDLHFMLFTKEKLENGKVVYNRKLDVEEGIDLLIIRDNKYYGICLYTDTPIGIQARDKKSKRHTQFTNVNYVELPLPLNSSMKCGDFYLYGINEFNKISELINYNYLQTSTSASGYSIQALR